MLVGSRPEERIAEMSVPACPMPTQNTKLMMYTPHHRRLIARGAKAFVDLGAHHCAGQHAEDRDAEQREPV